MKNLGLILICLILFVLACKKEDPTKAVIHYKLGGLYVRDSAASGSSGLKAINLGSDGIYCWTSVVFGNDSNFCNGTYEQTSDSTLLWNNDKTINFKITPVDTLPQGIADPKANGMFLQILADPPVYPLFGHYQ